MLPHPGLEFMPNVFAAVSEENKAISVQPVPLGANLPDYHLALPLLGCTLGIPDDLDHGNLGAFLNPADTIFGAA